ncbi:MAG: PAS domain S-box protein [Desulfosalsimonadaceae bacterium]
MAPKILPGELTPNPDPARTPLEQFIAGSDFYRLLADSITDVIWVLDANALCIAYAAPSVERLLGYTPGEVMALPLNTLMPESSMAVILSVIQEETDKLLARMAEPRTLEIRMFHKNGGIVWVECPARFIRDSEDRIIGIIGVARDCTERKNAAEALRVSEGRYRTILENIEEGYCEVDLAGNFVFANHSACTLLGYPEPELLGLNFRQLVDAETAERVFQAFSNVFQTGEPVKDFDYEVIRKDGTRRQVEIAVTLIRDQENRPVGFRGIGRDITTRKQAELQLKKAYDDLDRRVMERTAELARTNQRLEDKTKSLEEANIALRVLLAKKDENRKEVEDRMVFTVMESVSPMLEKIRTGNLSEKQQAYLEMIEAQLHKVTSPFSQSLSMQYRKLTPAEIQIANLVKHGKTSKEIAELANLAVSTVDFHRKNIRKKFQLDDNHGNLRTYLLSLEK